MDFFFIINETKKCDLWLKNDEGVFEFYWNERENYTARKNAARHVAEMPNVNKKIKYEINPGFDERAISGVVSSSGSLHGFAQLVFQFQQKSVCKFWISVVP